MALAVVDSPTLTRQDLRTPPPSPSRQRHPRRRCESRTHSLLLLARYCKLASASRTAPPPAISDSAVLVAAVVPPLLHSDILIHCRLDHLEGIKQQENQRELANNLKASILV
ncbi:hypothetical protein PIB30_029908 [Stylosanthes scabra]|uniref:Uncharacterized protein n=1 Tax=Stylosanthes scabra TaxID=79078 RepID=A0ABU6SC90_9FABA|nr:hypothetical protein [Stylosanthes scabra]